VSTLRGEGTDVGLTPLILIAGFLGAGKTTLLRALLPRLCGVGVRPHVILNDYENARVDAATIEGYSGLVRPIAGTCICCGSQEELMQELREAPLTPESVLLLEANGTADTTEIIEILTADRRASRYTLPVQVTVVDAHRWQRRGWNDRLERIQAQTAGYHLVTRLDQVTLDRRADVYRSLRTLAPGSRRVDPGEFSEDITALRSSSGSLPPRRFTRPRSGGGDPYRSAAGDPRRGRDHHATHHFASMEIPIPEPMESARLRELLESLPEEVLRIKGIARLLGFDHPVYFERTDAAESVEFTPIRRVGGLDFVAILIGTDLDDVAMRNVFHVLQRR